MLLGRGDGRVREGRREGEKEGSKKGNAEEEWDFGLCRVGFG